MPRRAESEGLGSSLPNGHPTPTGHNSLNGGYGEASEASPWGGLQPVYVHTLPKSLKADFALDGDYTRFEVSEDLRRLGSRLELSPAVFSFTFQGYKAYECQNKTCGVNRVYLPMVSTGVYHPYLSVKHSGRCVAQTLDVLDFVRDNTPADYASFICLTAPAWVSAGLLDNNTLPRFRRAVSGFLELLRGRLFSSKKSKLGAIFAVHTWSSKHPLEKHLHAHLILPNVAYGSNKKEFYRFKPLIDAAVVKECWREALRGVGLWDSNLPSGDLPDVHLQYVSLNPFDFEERCRLVHHIKYIFRLPLADLNENLELGDIEAFDDRFARFLFNYTTRRHRLGWLTNLKRFNGGPVCRKSNSQPCPLCGSEMIYLGRVRSNLPDILHVFRDRTGEWAQFPPPFEPLPRQVGDILPATPRERGGGRVAGVRL